MSECVITFLLIWSVVSTIMTVVIVVEDKLNNPFDTYITIGDLLAFLFLLPGFIILSTCFIILKIFNISVWRKK